MTRANTGPRSWRRSRLTRPQVAVLMIGFFLGVILGWGAAASLSPDEIPEVPAEALEHAATPTRGG